MAAATSPVPDERMNKRMKGEDSDNGPPQQEGMPPYPQQSQHPMPPQQQGYPPNHFRGPPPPHSQPGGAGGYYGGGPQYGGPPPPHHWQGGPPGPPPPGQGLYPQRGMSPDRQGPPVGPPGPNWNGGYRGSQPKGRKLGKPDIDGPEYWAHGPAQQFGGGPYGPPGPGWQGGPPPPPGPHMYGPGWSGKSPPRTGRHRDVYRHPDLDMQYVTRGQPHDDDGANSSAGGSTKDKGRGSYKCGRCGVPKKGHVCPYQPKLKRRPDEPPPEQRNAAVQVEMDEFMTLRRLNIKIQGYPESYVTEPYMTDNMVAGEPAHVPPPMPPGPPPEDHLPGNGAAAVISSADAAPSSSAAQDVAVGESPLPADPDAASI